MLQSVEEHNIRRDGVSQAERQLAALSPDYILVDERSTKDLLDFAKAYAEELNFFDVQNGQLQATDDGWRHFFAGVDIDEALAYLEAPESFTPEQAQPYARPHFALFLTFLELLGHTRSQINSLTRRHLEFFYHDVLKMVRKRAVPDRVHVLIDLDRGTDQQALPAATALRPELVRRVLTTVHSYGYANGLEYGWRKNDGDVAWTGRYYKACMEFADDANIEKQCANAAPPRGTCGLGSRTA